MKVLLFMFAVYAIGCSSAFAASRTVRFDCVNRVDVLLINPTKRVFDSVSGSDSAECWIFLKQSSARLNKLFVLVSEGNLWAGRYLIDHLKQLDGGVLEDSMRALGQYCEQNMDQFLRFRKEESVSEDSFGSALIMLALSLTDNPAGQLDAIKRRRLYVVRITASDLSDQKILALRIIDDFLSTQNGLRPR